MTTAPHPVPEHVALALASADGLVADGHHLPAIQALTEANRADPDPAIERRLVELRHRAFAHLPEAPGFERWPVKVDGPDIAGPPQIPEINRTELNAETVRRHISAHGSVLVRGLLDPQQVDDLVEAIDRAVEVRTTGPDSEAARTTGWFKALRLPKAAGQSLGRNWVGASGGVLALDSPTGLFRLLEAYEQVGLRDVVTGYLGEHPVLGANKTTLRRVPTDASADWHQDGAFLGAGIRALNVWVALSDCGVEAPGLDIVPLRFDHVQQTGTGGAIFDWAVGPDVVAELSADAPVVRPRFRAGDSLLFDELCLHRTALEPTMTRARYAIESWFFAPSVYPAGQVPLVW